VSACTEEEVQELESYPVSAILVDAHEPGRYGGTGKNSDWALASKVKKKHPLILAGGLNKENIKRAIETVRPCAVDINSGVEASPGRKNLHKIREIIEIIWATDKDEAPGNLFREGRSFEP
jgi:phosphoribosylanthranilate isomerase